MLITLVDCFERLVVRSIMSGGLFGVVVEMNFVIGFICLILSSRVGLVNSVVIGCCSRILALDC